MSTSARVIGRVVKASRCDATLPRDHSWSRDRRVDRRPIAATSWFKVSVYEQASALQEVGAGFVLTPNAMHALNFLGVVRAITATSNPTSELGFRQATDRGSDATPPVR